MREDESEIREGVPLRVLGISLPFLVCGVLQPGGQELGPQIVDVRRTSLALLDEAYVQAIIDFRQPEESPESIEEMNEMDGIDF